MFKTTNQELTKLIAAVEALMAVNKDLRDALDRQLKLTEDLLQERNQLRDECRQLHEAVRVLRGEWL